ncbi:transcriptional regulator, AraC family [Variovorax sp. PDC80]|uniref:helix-turn-helix domain-containing protein n=1 Tax=Variovorax sp. PDC80 TaxID=1882827 RepID=UPI0008E369A1|nr:AraC family transcriptional regulator [Variovorax sp. PDC80]SFQ16747.1 transcriptional regulator, AraC family [Variovorax sp. PDC80]
MGTQNYLHLWDDRFLYITPTIRSGLTARPSATLLVSASGRPFALEGMDGTRVRCTAALVAPHVPRRLDVDGCGLLSLNMEPSSNVARMLEGVQGDRGIQVIDAQCFGRLRERFEAALQGELRDSQLRELSTRMVEAVAGRPLRHVPLDPRIERVLERARTHVGPLPLRDLSAEACLSPDRLTHLFRQQLGLSIKRYLLWTKVRRTVQQFAGRSGPLADIAHKGGFTDMAHMSRTYQRCFGLVPSFLANGAQVQVRSDVGALHTWGPP